MILLIIVILIITYLIFINYIQHNINEQFEAGNFQQQDLKSNLIPYSYDQIFEDVVTFPNDIDPFIKTGMTKCQEQCNGNCIEYGQSGIGFCFPHKL